TDNTIVVCHLVILLLYLPLSGQPRYRMGYGCFLKASTLRFSAFASSDIVSTISQKSYRQLTKTFQF
ncbi:TPA: hypothetical protein ACGOOI_001908, partial [Streptococcus suis]